MAESLGSILAKRNKEAAAMALAAKKLAEQRAITEAAQHKAALIKIATEYFEDVKLKVTEALIAGLQVPYIYLPVDYNHPVYSVLGVGGNKSIVYNVNEAHCVWVEFSQWAFDNEMYVNWVQEPYEKTPGIRANIFYQLKFTPMVKS
jgi:hypothetical protein